MHPRTALCSLILLLCVVALCGSLRAQTGPTIIIRMLDAKTGKQIAASNYLVRIDHDQAIHANWVVQAEDGVSKLTLLRTAALLTMQGTYDSAEQIYLNCDAAGDKDKTSAHWYDVAAILATGVAAPNGCVSSREAAKLKIAAKPGEFIFFVRKRNIFEQAREDFGDR
jgi:hypothetical protein